MWPRLVGVAGLLAAFWGALIPAAQAHLSAQAHECISITALEWQTPEGNWQPQALPDDWGERGLPRPGIGRYRLQVQLPAVDDAVPWALWSARFPVHHRVWFNGALISDTLDVPDALQARTAPGLLRLPAALRREGGNEVLIEEKGGPRAGLGVLSLGPEFAIEQLARKHRRLFVDTTRALNGLAGGVALYALLLWARRRSEVTLGWFGALALVLALRNIVFVEPAMPTPGGSSLLMFGLIVAVNLMFGFFGLSLGAPTWRAWRYWIVSVAVLALLAGLSRGGDPAGLDQLRRWVYPVLSANALVAAGLLVRAAWRQGRRSFWLLAGLGLGFVLAGVYDMLLQAGRLPQHWEFALPWISPLLAVLYGGMLAARLVRAMQEAERASWVLEQRVRERTVALEASNAAKTRFLAAASHDLRQPMVTIGVLIGVLREQLSSPAQQGIVARVDEAVAAMESLLAGLLDLSRLESGGLRVVQDAVALAPLLQMVARHEQEAAARKGLQLRLHVPAHAVVQGDAVLIEQILRNLISNALRYTDHGGVLVGVRSRGSRWRVSVWDSGPGIPAEQQARVFEDFVQLDNPQRKREQGLGLGLAIVRRAVNLLGTRIELRSTVAKGSCFSFELPTAMPASKAVGPDRHHEDGVPAPPQLAGLRVALVEDDDGARGALTLRLQVWGAEVLPFASATETALCLKQGKCPPLHLLLTDMRLPGGSGLEVVAQVRAAQGKVPALILTGNTAPEQLAELAASGLQVLHKPFRAEQLAQALKAVLQG